ncbi:MAG: fumarylacetoacetate hydrolase family protein [Candidatus Bathyarchaeia archaeon]|jgi:2-keto-4-pentenoate hydratase/2-oxohepta-3-ene-1,7-dioic acid hydratase in catechol pathway
MVRYQHKGKEYYGVMQYERLVYLGALAKRLKTDLPSEIEAFIVNQTAQKTAEELLTKAKNSDLDSVSIPLSEARLLAPIASPPKILCLGLNFATHVDETKENRPEEPVIFMKPRTAIAGPNDKIIKRPFVKELDYEGELAIVIGKKAKDVPASEALNYVFGYTILNDVSARDFQFRSSQWTPGKSFDTFAPTGPYITMSNQLPDPGSLTIKAWINGELRQNGNTHDMIFSVAQIIHHLSRVMTLEPCDIIATGTPSGVAMAMKPPKWLNAGDVVRIEIEGIGTLENTVEEM